jgi:hypothetical protein
MKRSEHNLSAGRLFAVMLLSLVLVAGGRSVSQAEMVYDQSGLATCVPDSDDPCADIVAPGSSINRIKDASPRRVKIEQSPVGVSQSAAGAEPQLLENPGLSLNKPAVTPKAIRYINTKVIQRNTTQYGAYWRVGAIRGSNGWAWPSGSTYYTVRKYSSVSKLIRCIQGETLYFGATSTNGQLYWGYGADFDQRCTSGCTGYCSGGTITITMR